MLLEKGEFVKDKKTKAVVWIEGINRYDNTITIGSMSCDIIHGKPIYEKAYKRIDIGAFYQDYIDIKGEL